jgi:hypothetical protein
MRVAPGTPPQHRVSDPDFDGGAAVAFTEQVGPFVVRDASHFLARKVAHV